MGPDSPPANQRWGGPKRICTGVGVTNPMKNLI
jgi:hypothetical protein